MDKIRKYLAQIGRLGGLRSRRTLTREAARDMVAVREARRAYRRFHEECFAPAPADLRVYRDDVPWLAERLIRHGGSTAQDVGRRIAQSISLTNGPKPPRDTSRTADAMRLAAIRRQRPADRLRQALELSESTRAFALASLRQKHPERSDRRLVELIIGAALPERGLQP